MYKIEKGIGNVKLLDNFLKFNNNAIGNVCLNYGYEFYLYSCEAKYCTSYIYLKEINRTKPEGY